MLCPMFYFQGVPEKDLPKMPDAVHLPPDLMAHLDTGADSSIEAVKAAKEAADCFKVEQKGERYVHIDDVFDRHGRWRWSPTERAERMLREVVVVSTAANSQTYYQLTTEPVQLKRDAPKYLETQHRFESVLAKLFKSSKKRQLQESIRSFNETAENGRAPECAAKILEVAKHLVYFFSLNRDHLETKEFLADEGPLAQEGEGTKEAEGESTGDQAPTNDSPAVWVPRLNAFVDRFHHFVRHIMVVSQDSQDVIVDVKIAIDNFSQDVLGRVRSEQAFYFTQVARHDTDVCSSPLVPPAALELW